MAFNALTNSVPNSPIQTAPGTVNARIVPMIMPITIRRIRATPLYLAAMPLNIFVTLSIVLYPFLSLGMCTRIPPTPCADRRTS